MARHRLEVFVDDIGNARSKRGTPNLPELLALVTVLAHLESEAALPSPTAASLWHRLYPSFIVEYFARQVPDLLRVEPTLEIREEWDSYDMVAIDFRLTNTFYHSQTALRALMFQVQFMKAVIETAAVGEELNGIGPGYGYIDFPPAPLASWMKKEIPTIMAIRSWSAFFREVDWPGNQMESSDPRAFAAFLRSSIILSGRRRHHRPVGSQPIDLKERSEIGSNRTGSNTVLREQALRAQRWWVEKEWLLVRGCCLGWNEGRVMAKTSWGAWDTDGIERESGCGEQEGAVPVSDLWNKQAPKWFWRGPLLIFRCLVRLLVGLAVLYHSMY